jgi:hypothetical protein
MDSCHAARLTAFGPCLTQNSSDFRQWTI